MNTNEEIGGDIVEKKSYFRNFIINISLIIFFIYTYILYKYEYLE